MEFARYRVFADAPHGGKLVAVAHPAQALGDAELQAAARESGAPLTAFVTSAGDGQVSARFFTPGKEKGESDSGALVVAHHLHSRGLAGDALTVLAGGEALNVQRSPQGWASRQPDTRVRFEVDPAPLLAALGLSRADLDARHPVLACGADRLNVILPLLGSAVLDTLWPDFTAVREFSEATGTNGVIAATVNSARDSSVDFRFFAPRRGLDEDNAGSYTLASLCAFLAARCADITDVSATQGYGMDKPSRLHARFTRENDAATGILVSGAVRAHATEPTGPLEVQA